MVARASASVFLGEELCQNEDILSTCSMLAFDLGQEIVRKVVNFKVPNCVSAFD
jgi:hypothetical protein